LIKGLLNLFYPRLCTYCGKPLLDSEIGLCIDCLYKLPRTGNYKLIDNRPSRLMAGRLPFDRIATFAAFTDGGILQSVVHKLKYDGKKEYGVFLGRLFGEDLKGSDFVSEIDCIVPVPLHAKKIKSRGYNQSEVIASGMSEILSVPVSTGVLVRKIHNPTQTKLSKTERWMNVRDIFELDDEKAYENKHILLVDDILTTGATIEACGIALSKCKNITISIATLGEVY
jgi:ComF family protein